MQFVVSYKRLDRGVFRLPEPSSPESTAVAIDEGALEDLLDGIDLEAAAPRRPRREKKLLPH